MQTLPQWMLTLGVSIDQARKLIRQRPDLKTIGTRHGPTRVYTADEARQIAEAVGEWLAAKRGATPAVAV